MKIQDAKVIVTGGSSGIGYATAELLRDKGARVLINGKNREKLEKAAMELKLPFYTADIQDPSEVKSMTQKAIEVLGGYNVLINNAGYGYSAPLTDMDPDEFEYVWRTNVYGAMLCAKEAARHFVGQQYGHIINVGSTSSLKGSPNASAYNATKFALRGMTEAWRYELRQYNIRVMQVNPSEVMTYFASSRKSNEGLRQKVYTENEKRTKLRSEEIAHTIVSMLEMDDRGFITEATVFATNPQV